MDAGLQLDSKYKMFNKKLDFRNKQNKQNSQSALKNIFLFVELTFDAIKGKYKFTRA